MGSPVLTILPRTRRTLTSVQILGAAGSYGRRILRTFPHHYHRIIWSQYLRRIRNARRRDGPNNTGRMVSSRTHHDLQKWQDRSSTTHLPKEWGDHLRWDTSRRLGCNNYWIHDILRSTRPGKPEKDNTDRISWLPIPFQRKISSRITPMTTIRSGNWHRTREGSPIRSNISTVRTSKGGPMGILG